MSPKISYAAILVAFAICIFLLCLTPAAIGRSSADTAPVAAVSPYIDGHTHFDATDVEASIHAALQGLAVQNAAKIFLLVPPETYDYPGRYDADVILPAAKKYPGKLAVLGGGGTLNAMIQQSVHTGDAGAEVRRKFKKAAEQLVAGGVAGFGEMTAEHFSTDMPYQYQYAPADHPLFLLLADIAARHGIPIVLHMEAVPQDMALPPGLQSPPNAPRLHGNIAAFERLLRHNPRSTIIWAHAGSDLSGFRTPDLCRHLLQAHSNLHMEIKVDALSIGKNSPLVNGASGAIKPEWLKLFQDFPDRFIIGSDQHYPEPKQGPQRWQTDVLLLNQLPADLRRKIGMENAVRLYSPHSVEVRAAARE